MTRGATGQPAPLAVTYSAARMTTSITVDPTTRTLKRLPAISLE